MEANYFDQVYYVTRRIPHGRVTNYGAIADYLSLGSARMVGWALNKCASADSPVPAHRVVNRKGELSARNQFPHPEMMGDLLRNEGVEIINYKVQDFSKLLWIPGDHLPSVLDIKDFKE